MKVISATVLLAVLGSLDAPAVPAGPALPAASGDTVQVLRGRPGPQGVRIDGAADTFADRTTYFEKSLPATPAARLYDIVIDFGSYQVPMRLISGQRNGEPLRFTVTAPDYTQCERPTVQAIGARAPSGTIDERVDLLVRARRLIELCDAPAYRDYVLPGLVMKYYEVSCALATRGSAFAMHDDVKARFAKLTPTTATRRALADCNGRGTGNVLAAQWGGVNAAFARADYAAAITGAEDMLGKLDDQKWQDGFEAQGLSGDLVREFKVKSLVREQQTVARRDPAQALEINDELLALHDKDDFRATTLNRQGASKDQLLKDRAYLSGLQAAGPQ